MLGDKDIFSSSYERVINYDTAYEAPAPFNFYVVNETLKAIESKSYTLKVRTEGEVFPENASISYNNETYYLQQTAPGAFEYTFSQPVDPIDFKLQANKVTSQTYTLDVVKTPSLLGFEMALDYPNHTGKRDEVMKSTGNATVPEGTHVRWIVSAKNTDLVQLKTRDTAYSFSERSKSLVMIKAFTESLIMQLQLRTKI